MTKKLLCALVCCLFLPVFAGTCSAYYPLQEHELTRLEMIFNQLAQNNNALLSDLTESKQDLAQARQKLAQYQRELQALQAQLLELKQESMQAGSNLAAAQNSLMKANASLERYEKEVRAKTRLIKLERNICLLAAVWFAAR